jgi:hypothetical protein
MQFQTAVGSMLSPHEIQNMFVNIDFSSLHEEEDEERLGG